MSQQGGGGDTSSQPDCMKDIIRWWNAVPTGNKIIYITCIAVTAGQLFGAPLAQMMVCSNSMLLQWQVWRLFTAQFVNDLMGLAFGLFSIYQTAISLEQSLGTIYFILDFMFKNMVIQLFNFVLLLIMQLVLKQEDKSFSYGLFNIVILFVSLRSFSNPETESKFMCFPIMIKNKFQPFALLAFFTLISGMIRTDFIAAIILGLIEVKFFGGMMLRISKERLTSLKGFFIFRFIAKHENFIEADLSLPQVISQPQSRENTAAVSSNTNTSSTPFSGRAVTIGGGPSRVLPAPIPPHQQQNEKKITQKDGQKATFKRLEESEQSGIEEKLTQDSHPTDDSSSSHIVQDTPAKKPQVTQDLL